MTGSKAADREMLRIEHKGGDALRVLLPELAHLRIEVFHDWPYLYDGTLAYEEVYLSHFLDAPDHIAICAFDGDQLVGAATASPLIHQSEDFTAPFRSAGIALEPIFYFGESVLLPSYRGRGIGHAFFDGREAHAQSLGFAKTSFCGVVRPSDHPARPTDYRPLDAFWRKRGYLPLEGIIGSFSWREIGQSEETAKPMQYWGRGF
jgi:GNAT superfamily N-acetyltransferase